jgi:general secretion pathway protein I
MARSPIMNYRKSSSGLTLIEVLVALAIIAIAMTAIIKAASQNIRSTSYLQHKTLALWVGQNVINQARVGVIKLPDGGDWSDNTVTIMGEEWHWRGRSEMSANKHIRKLSVDVFASESEEESPVISLESFSYEE